MIGTENLTFEVVGHTAIVTMNRPEAKNALSLPMLVGMVDAWDEIDANDAIRCAILTGAGGTFCSGMDLKSMSDPANATYAERMAADPDLHWKALLRHRNLAKPLIAAVEGYAVAGGTEILQGTDIRVAGEHATFGLFEVALERALEIAEVICANAPLAVEAVKRSVIESEGMSEVDGLANELEIGWPIFATADAKEGPRAFAEKRPAVFTKQ